MCVAGVSDGDVGVSGTAVALVSEASDSVKM